ncbi:carbohydrate sulfotransferase 11 isoform X2 [Bacillus rossius redtenbacheri]|uniref:carbohydrate sulfotransferase 11 isoform X2 n=1 Tax=Bacillus rossius redtenbacheri TaxID=93214 RepID=UPI002FDD1D98
MWELYLIWKLNRVACTNWKRIFLVLTGQANTTDVLAIPASVAHEKGLLSKLSNYSVADINLFLKTFSKFLFVRHPFERLLSAYHNKLEQRYHSSKYFQTRFGRFIIKNYRINPSNESLIKGDDVTFNEFAAYLVDPKMSFNEHWIPIYNLCHPCLINYDIIGKYETLYEDSDFVLRSAGVHTKFPRLTKTSSTSNKLYKYFNSLSENTINKLYNIYLLDFKLFGYTLNKF